MLGRERARVGGNSATQADRAKKRQPSTNVSSFKAGTSTMVHHGASSYQRFWEGTKGENQPVTKQNCRVGHSAESESSLEVSSPFPLKPSDFSHYPSL